MEDSDSLILLTLKQLGCTLKAESISKLTADELILVILQIFKSLGIDIRNITSIESSQKYRIANKIVDELKKNFGIQVEFILFVNPNAVEVRNLLIALISKISSKENSKGYEPQALSYEEKLEAERNKRNIEFLKNWRNQEWILPELLNFPAQSKDFDNLDISKENLRKEIITLRIPKRKYNSLYFSTLGSLNRWKMDHEQSSKKDYYSKPIEQQKTEKRLKITQNNKDAWAVTLKKTNNKDTLSDFLKSKDKEENAIQNPTQQEPTLYSLELQFKQEETIEAPLDENSKPKLEIDIEKIRASHKEELEKIEILLNEKQQTVISLEENMNSIEEQKQKMEEELQSLKESNLSIQDSTESLHELLTYLEDPDKKEKELKDIVKNLEDDIAEMKGEWTQHRTKVMSKIEKYKTTIEENKVKDSAFIDVSGKIGRENDYDSLIQKIKTNYDFKQHLQNELANLPKEVNRNIFVKRINEINGSYLKQKNDLNKILNDVELVQKNLDYNTALCEKFSTEVENMLKEDSKPDSQTKAILKMFQEYSDIFQGTVKNLKEQGKSKLASRDLERKIDILTSKNYGTLITKIQNDVAVLKEENAKLMVMYQSKMKN